MGLLGRGKKDTNTIGDISEAAIITRFLQLGYVVLTPYGETIDTIWLLRMPRGDSGAYNVRQLE